MSMGDDFDKHEPDPSELIKKEFKRISDSLHARMSGFMEQLSTLATHQTTLESRMNGLDAASTITTANLMLNANDIKVLFEEIVALETYLATKDPELKKILDKNIKAIKKIMDKADKGKNDPPPTQPRKRGL